VQCRVSQGSVATYFRWSRKYDNHSLNSQFYGHAVYQSYF